MTININDIEAAAERMQGAIIRTPTQFSHTLSAIIGVELYLKFENQQFTASFKDRGALNKLLSLSNTARKSGVIAVSAGNHAQGVAYHCERLGIPATIVMPRSTPFAKIRATEYFGPKVMLSGDNLSEAMRTAEALIASENLTFIPPFDDDAVIAGQGTVALEMLQDVPTLDTLVVPVGGGGLIGGMAVAAKSLKPSLEIVGVEVEAYSAMHAALHNAHAECSGITLAEGIAVKDVAPRTIEIARKLVREILLVSESDIERAITLLLNVEKTVAEGAGAAAMAALLSHGDKFAGRKVGVVISGGNIDPRLLASIIMRDLLRDGRIANLRIEIEDQPGSLAEIARHIGEAGGNIVEILHQRLFLDVPAKRTELDMMIEARDAAHMEQIINAVRQSGYPTRIVEAVAGQPPRSPAN
ncbi:MAG TPA: threonine ammonia-lyase [Alphaproteobacteria bacterium]|nr:threonine ammonia-lyase [Alphaproteobacteria bacterium]